MSVLRASSEEGLKSGYLHTWVFVKPTCRLGFLCVIFGFIFVCCEQMVCLLNFS